jgi:hypothetical protein
MILPIRTFLLCWCGLLSAAETYQLLSPEATYVVPTLSSSAAPPVVPQIPEFDPPPVELLVEFNGHPLFNPTRQPITPKIEDTSPPPPNPQVSFIGTIGQAGERIAIVKTPAEPLAFSVRLGSPLDGWQVADISSERIVLAAKNARYEVKISQAPPSPPRQIAATTPKNQGGTRGRAVKTAPALSAAERKARFRGVQRP